MVVAGLGCGSDDAPDTSITVDSGIPDVAPDIADDELEPDDVDPDPGPDEDEPEIVDPDTVPDADETGSPCLAEDCPLPDHPCLEAVCVDGECAEAPGNQGAACQTDLCKPIGVCGAGECAQELDIDCDDDNPCTADGCKPDEGCIHQATEGNCDDGDPCTTKDFCGGGSCVPGGPLACDDGLECTDDACAPGVGCVHTSSDGGCLIEGECYAPGEHFGIFGDDACLVCDPEQDLSGWSFDPGGWLCGTDGSCDGLLWNVQQVCGPGTGECVDDLPVDCTGDGDPCLDYGCHPDDGCTTTPKADGTECGDGACNVHQWTPPPACDDGKCKEQPTVDCSAGDGPCRDGLCEPAGCVFYDAQPGTACQIGPSGVCEGSEWHPPDVCNAFGICIDGGAENCATAATICEDGVCTDTGCSITALPADTPCSPASCEDKCTAAPLSKCDGEGACIPGG